MKKPYTIEEIKRIAAPIAKAHGVKRMGLFGSYARGEANEESDVDFLIEEGKIESLYDYFALVLDLEEKFQSHIDVVTSGTKNQEFWRAAKKDEVLLYEE